MKGDWIAYGLSMSIVSLALSACGGSDGKDGADGINGTNGVNGTNSTIQTSVEAVGKNCSNGGIKIEVLQDGVVQESQTQYICNAAQGEQGIQGAAGQNALLNVLQEPAGENCINGGVKVENGLDTDSDGVLAEDEISETQYICNGRNGGSGETPAMASKIIFSKDTLTTDESGSIDTVTVKLAKKPTSLVFVPVWSSNESEATVHPDNLIFTPENWDEPQTLTVHGVADRVADGDVYYYIFSETISKDAELDGAHTILVGKNLAMTAAMAGVEYIDIPAGGFTLTHETGTYENGNEVQLLAFKLGKTPVTVAQFQKCVAQGVCSSDNYSVHYNNNDSLYCNYNRGDAWKNHPMNCVNWYGAKEYCEWIGGRLPTEEEWEYASTHNGTTHLNTTYPWGDDAPTHCVTAQYYDTTTHKFCQSNAAAPMLNDNYEGTSDVSLHSPTGDSPLGLVDMSGNVAEWTASSVGIHDYHVLKGGGWSYIEGGTLMLGDVLTVSGRRTSGGGGNVSGFRCAE